MPKHKLDPEILQKVKEIDERFHSPRGLKPKLIELCLTMQTEGRKYCAAELRRMVELLRSHGMPIDVLINDKRFQEICLDPDRRLLTDWRAPLSPNRRGKSVDKGPNKDS